MTYKRQYHHPSITLMGIHAICRYSVQLWRPGTATCHTRTRIGAVSRTNWVFSKSSSLPEPLPPPTFGEVRFQRAVLPQTASSPPSHHSISRRTVSCQYPIHPPTLSSSSVFTATNSFPTTDLGAPNFNFTPTLFLTSSYTACKIISSGDHEKLEYRTVLFEDGQHCIPDEGGFMAPSKSRKVAIVGSRSVGELPPQCPLSPSMAQLVSRPARIGPVPSPPRRGPELSHVCGKCCTGCRVCLAFTDHCALQRKQASHRSPSNSSTATLLRATTPRLRTPSARLLSTRARSSQPRSSTPRDR